MILNFYVQGKPPGSSSTSHNDPPESYLNTVERWTRDKVSLLSELTLNEAVEWTKDRALNVWERSKGAFRYLSGAPLPPVSLPVYPTEDIMETKKAKSKGWSFIGMFSGLRGNRTGSTETNVKRAHGEMWTDGEVHADLIRVCLPCFPYVQRQTDSYNRTTMVILSSDIY
jgi:mitochondrial import inner membrane translocase subunit TIM21